MNKKIKLHGMRRYFSICALSFLCDPQCLGEKNALG
jgi:hypothetical protein